VPRISLVPDDPVSDARRRNMSAIRAVDTGPEMVVRRYLFGKGYRYRLHVPGLPGRPDIVLPRFRKVIEVRGCFWHRHRGCTLAATPKTRRPFWLAKFRKNVQRDRKNEAALRSEGWDVLVLWECEIEDGSFVAGLGDFLCR
jgi:DNA mismatch endonuclease Vsr